MQLLDRYEEVVGHHEVERLRRLASRLAGRRLVHVNSTRVGGGVAEILGWMVPLMRELGLDVHWEVITGPPDFYRVTKAIHNGLQGLPVVLKPSDFDLHHEVNKQNAERLNLAGDVVVVHDPQPIFLPAYTPRDRCSAGSGAVTSTPRGPTAWFGSTWPARSSVTRRPSSRWRPSPGRCRVRSS